MNTGIEVVILLLILLGISFICNAVQYNNMISLRERIIVKLGSDAFAKVVKK